jgi:protein required for attachment to host cells
MMQNTWILIASSSEAHFYAYNHDHYMNKERLKMNLLESYEHKESRMKDSDLVSGQLGHYNTPHLAHGSFVPETDPKQHEAEVFAIELSKTLYHYCMENKYKHLILVAPPHFVGLLHKHLNKHVAEVISQTIEKDYTKIPLKQLTEYIEEHLKS